MNIRAWKGPTIADIARVSGLGTATVDRVLNGRSGVKESSRAKVQAAMELLAKPSAPEIRPLRIAFLSESGVTFNRTLETAVEDFGRANPGVECKITCVTTAALDPVKFANLIERSAEESDGLVIVAREDMMINRAIRNVTARRTPVVSLTTDLPMSGRAAFVGSDQTSAGATAAFLMGRALGGRQGKILLVYSAPYRAQEERELGFRRVLRAEFSQLEIDDRVNSNDDSEHSYRHVMKYVEDHGAPAGVYNTVGGNLGIGRALRDCGLDRSVVFAGHELNVNSKLLLEGGEMDFVIAHDIDAEVAQSVIAVQALIEGRPPPPSGRVPVRIYTKYNCH